MTKQSNKPAAQPTLEDALKMIADLQAQLAAKPQDAKQSAPGVAFEVVAGNMTVEPWGNRDDAPTKTEGANIADTPSQTEDVSHKSYAIMSDGTKVEVNTASIVVERFGAPIKPTQPAQTAEPAKPQA